MCSVLKAGNQRRLLLHPEFSTHHRASNIGERWMEFAGKPKGDSVQQDSEQPATVETEKSAGEQRAPGVMSPRKT